MDKPKKMTTETIAELLKLHKKGWSLHQLGNYFNIDHSSVAYWLNKEKQGLSLIPYNRMPFYKIPEKKGIKSTELLPPEKINRGLNYKEYIAILAKRTNKSIRSLMPYKGHHREKD